MTVRERLSKNRATAGSISVDGIRSQKIPSNRRREEEGSSGSVAMFATLLHYWGCCWEKGQCDVIRGVYIHWSSVIYCFVASIAIASIECPARLILSGSLLSHSLPFYPSISLARALDLNNSRSVVCCGEHVYSLNKPAEKRLKSGSEGSDSVR